MRCCGRRNALSNPSFCLYVLLSGTVLGFTLTGKDWRETAFQANAVCSRPQHRSTRAYECNANAGVSLTLRATSGLLNRRLRSSWPVCSFFYPACQIALEGSHVEATPAVLAANIAAAALPGSGLVTAGLDATNAWSGSVNVNHPLGKQGGESVQQCSRFILLLLMKAAVFFSCRSVVYTIFLRLWLPKPAW